MDSTYHLNLTNGVSLKIVELMNNNKNRRRQMATEIDIAIGYLIDAQAHSQLDKIMFCIAGAMKHLKAAKELQEETDGEKDNK